MRTLLTPLLQLQRFFIPTMLILLLWAIWRGALQKDRAVGLALYACLIVVVDGFYNTGLYIPGMAQGSIRYSEVCALFLLLQPKGATQKASNRQAILFLVGAYFSLMFLAALRADPMSAGIADFRRIMFPQILAFILACRGFETLADYRRFLVCMTVLIFIVGIFCFWDVFFDINILYSDVLLKPEYTHNRKIGRFGSIFLNPNFLGAFVVLMFPLLLTILIKEVNRWQRAYLVAGMLALLFCLVQTQSRAPLAAFAGSIAIFVMGPVGGLSRKRRFAAIAGAATLFALLLPGFFEHASQRFTTGPDETSTEAVTRGSTWKYAMRLIGERPLLGWGFGESQFISAMGTTDFQARYGKPPLDNPHNSYLQAAVYAGILAVACFVLANLVLLTKALKAFRRTLAEDGHATEIFGLAVGLTGLLICSYPDMHLFTANIAPLYWLFTGLLLSFVSQDLGRWKPGARRLLISTHY